MSPGKKKTRNKKGKSAFPYLNELLQKEKANIGPFRGVTALALWKRALAVTGRTIARQLALAALLRSLFLISGPRPHAQGKSSVETALGLQLVEGERFL